MPGLRDILDAATPGPWVADETLSDPGKLHNVWRTSGSGLRAVAHDITEFDNARLIALAPELAALVLDMGERMAQFKKASPLTEFGQTRIISYEVLSEIFSPLLALDVMYAATSSPVLRDDPDTRGTTGTEPETGDENSLGWHTISGVHLLEVMRRCSAGEDADAVFAELWANAEHHREEES